MRNGALKNLRERKRKGFTLVELLIVIIIIGILAGAMLLVAGAGTDKAEATKIVSDLRSMKSAALMYYADNNAWASTDIKQLNAYMDRQIEDAKYIYAFGNGGKSIGCTNVPAGGIQGKLASIAKDSGLFKTAATDSSDVYDTGNSVYMRVH